MFKWFILITISLFTANRCMASVGVSGCMVMNYHTELIDEKTEAYTTAPAPPDSLHFKQSPRQNRLDLVKRIKEIARTKNQAKPEKITAPADTTTNKQKGKPARQRRPEGLERPPEIPRRTGD